MACLQRTGRRLLPLTAVVLTAAVLASLSLVLPRVVPWGLFRDPASPLVRFVDVRAEANLHTWFNVAVLSVGACSHACVGVLARAAGGPAWPWAVAAGTLALLAIDDLAALHEQLEPIGRALGAGEGALHFAWLLPGVALAVGLAVVAVAAARRLPRASARWLLAGMSVLLSAAFGLEAAGGALLASVGDGPAYILVSHLEEFLETCAAGMLLHAAIRAVEVRRGTRPGSVEMRHVHAPAVPR